MNNRHIDDRQLEELLRRTAEQEQEAPLWLKQNIMNRVHQRKPRRFEWLRRWFVEPMNLRFSPVGVVSVTALVVAAFWGGILVERNTGESESQQPFRLAAFADNARANYLIGRGLLAGEQQEASLRFFQKAVELVPQSAEYVHWQGIAYGTLGNQELERQSYAQTVQDHPDFAPSLINLGHSYLESGNYSAALQQYQAALQHDPRIPEALYNTALAYHKLNDTSQERQAFTRYLASYRTGKWANRAVDHLHRLDDFSFRSYRIGIHSVVLSVPALFQPGSPLQREEVERLAGVVRRTTGQELHIVVYNKEKKNEAKEAALSLRKQLIDELGPDHEHLIRTSWFDAAETISTENGDKEQLSPSVLIFSNPINTENRRNST